MTRILGSTDRLKFSSQMYNRRHGSSSATSYSSDDNNEFWHIENKAQTWLDMQKRHPVHIVEMSKASLLADFDRKYKYPSHFFDSHTPVVID